MFICFFSPLSTSSPCHELRVPVTLRCRGSSSRRCKYTKKAVKKKEIHVTCLSVCRLYIARCLPLVMPPAWQNVVCIYGVRVGCGDRCAFFTLSTYLLTYLPLNPRTHPRTYVHTYVHVTLLQNTSDTAVRTPVISTQRDGAERGGTGRPGLQCGGISSLSRLVIWLVIWLAGWLAMRACVCACACVLPCVLETQAVAYLPTYHHYVRK